MNQDKLMLTPTKIYNKRSDLISCRLCGKESKRSYGIFSKSGVKNQLSSKITMCTGIEILKTDNTSDIICRNCERFIASIVKFRQACFENNRNRTSDCSIKRVILPPENEKYTKDVLTIHTERTATTQFDISTIKKDMKTKSTNLCHYNDGSTLLCTNYDALSNFNVNIIWDEIVANFPLLIEIFNSILNKDCAIHETEEKHKLKFSFIYSILMNTRWDRLSLFQRVNLISMTETGASKKLIERFNKLGICLSHTSKLRILDEIGGHFADILAKDVKAGKTLRGTGDNWDMTISMSHMRKGINNQSLHLFATNIIVNRIDFTHKLNIHPKRDLATCSRSVFLLNVNEIKQLKENFKTLVGRICIEFLTKFKFLKSVVPNHIEHKYSKKMSNKSTIVSLPILDCNETKYNEVTEILRTYEQWVFQIYKKAGMIDHYPYVLQNPQLPENAESRPSQPGAHVHTSIDDPMYDMRIPFAGDQLTRVRFAGAKDLLIGAHTPADRFEHCTPFKGAMFHTKASYLQFIYNYLYKAESVNEIGTLKYFREKYNRKNATPQKVLDSYEGSEELILSIGKSYLVVALLNFFQMQNLGDLPTSHIFDTDIENASFETKEKYFDNVIGEFVDSFIFQRNQSPPVSVEEDYLKNYALLSIYLSTFLMQIIDTTKEGDGDRNLINQKNLLVIFRSLNCFSKYSIEMFVAIAQVECLTTERMSEEIKWGYFSNWNGGKGRNIEDDLAQEIYNRISKNAVNHMGANKNIDTISKISRATTGLKEISENFDSQLKIKKSSVRHTTRSSHEDELGMIEDIKKINPFNFVSGRMNDSFPKIKRHPTRYLNCLDYHQWIDKQKKQMSGCRFSILSYCIL